MKEVIDTNQLLNNNNINNNNNDIIHVTLESDENWRQRFSDAYIIKQAPGLIIIPNPFTPKAQRNLIELCLTDYAVLPNKSNLDAHYDRTKVNLWELYEKEQKGLLTDKEKEEGYYLQPLKASEQKNDQQRYNDNNNNNNNNKQMGTSRGLPPLSPMEALIKQRWITLGYQYDWKTKVYDLETPLPIPKELNDLAKSIVHAVEGIGYDDHSSSSWSNQYKGSVFKSEAGVINYYQLKDTLMAHVDKSEVNMDAPLVSVSFGHACIYLIGGSTKDIPPIPLCLRSGDIIVMTGESRNSYHGVPRILENSLPKFLSNENEDWTLFGNYMNHSRINLNIRQVFNPSTDNNKIQ
ncbi:unnamed protein product [Cunninghamella echinulata]